MTTAVLKFGGEVIADAPALAAVLGDVARLTAAGWKFAICHGGGPQANALQERLGLQPIKVGGRRVTDEATLQVMKYVLAGELSVDVVAAALAAGLGGALGLSGVSAGLVSARKRPPTRVSGGGEELVDFGLVGDVVEIRTAVIEHLWAGGYTPVINTLGVGLETAGFACPVFNINADTVSSAIAGALKVDHLFLMTGVPGVLRDKDDPSTRIARLSAAEARGAIEMKVIVGGMIPKVEEALANLALGIGAVHVLGATAGALQAEAATPGSVGTVLVA
ncbi:acetylglutamate kinase [Nannocystis sp. ILAH1]|uniref:acetylglutamate kinase n=1 Tax=unclassified Nannocystis TaxID=2627009 RepID=UPI002270EE92|nr:MULTISPECIES: acetylglutamate kinase [unclassified Nannocystis]MCY0990124.1 acetylglutamate kinase [Nannocystis sp. ILAH1]MCY1069587.1 acetylglutamate kinase [Nannocystis sp. RBIL2]